MEKFPSKARELSVSVIITPADVSSEAHPIEETMKSQLKGESCFQDVLAESGRKKSSCSNGWNRFQGKQN